MGKRYVVALVVLAAAALASFVLPAQGGRGQGSTGQGSTTIYMSALEYKGAANVADEAWPPADEPGTSPLEPLGGGYDLVEPDDTGRWQVESYRFEPGFLTVKKDTKVTLEIAGINGSRHDVDLINPSGNIVKSAVITRGRLTTVVFRPQKAGMWKLACGTHPPNMTASILVTE